MGITAFPVVSGAQVTANGDATAKHEPGTILAYRSATDQWAMVEYVQADNNVITKGSPVVKNFATLKQYSVRLAATTDSGVPIRGVSLATIASQRYGFVAIGGYVESAQVSHTTASGEFLRVSGSANGQLTPDAAGVFNAATSPNVSAFVVVAVSHGIIATDAFGSITLCGVWA